jgi:hypothetical protein
MATLKNAICSENDNANILVEEYIEKSKKMIDNLLIENETESAFNILIMVLTKLEGKHRTNFIKYYDSYVYKNYTGIYTQFKHFE